MGNYVQIYDQICQINGYALLVICLAFMWYASFEVVKLWDVTGLIEASRKGPNEIYVRPEVYRHYCC